jgi:RimJ/RimL family protein N-acetyltransferase
VTARGAQPVESGRRLPVETRRFAAFGPAFVQLETPRLTLRPMVEVDVDSIARQPGEVAPENLLAGAPDRDALRAMLRAFEEEWQVHGLGHLLVFENESRFLVGHVSLKPFRRPSGGSGAEIAYGIDTNFRGKGYGGEATAAALLLTFDLAGLDYVLACVEPDNVPSLRLVRRLGFVAIGEGKTHGRVLRRFLIGRIAWRNNPAAQAVGRGA